MHRDEVGEVTIHNHRPSRLTGSLMLFALACSWAAALAVRSTGEIDRVVSPEVFLCGLAFISWIVLVLTYLLQGARSLNLGEQLIVWPQWWTFRHDRIRSITFAPDPAEDFDESAPALRFCEIRIQPRRRFAIRLIAQVADGLRIWHWAVRRGINVFDPTQILDDINVPPGSADAGRPGSSETTQSPS